MAKDPNKVRFGLRLRATAEEFGVTTARGIAEIVGQERAAAETWLNGRAYPKVDIAAKLCDEWGVTLDWLFRGRPEGLPHGTYVRIRGLLEGERPPMVSEPKEKVAIPSPMAAVHPPAATEPASAKIRPSRKSPSRKNSNTS